MTGPYVKVLPEKDPQQPMTGRCWDCIYYVAQTCRRNAPTSRAGSHHPCWPAPGNNSSCGEFYRREDEA